MDWFFAALSPSGIIWYDVLKDQISAKVEDGILTITMPKTEPKEKVTKAIEVS